MNIVHIAAIANPWQRIALGFSSTFTSTPKRTFSSLFFSSVSICYVTGHPRRIRPFRENRTCVRTFGTIVRASQPPMLLPPLCLGGGALHSGHFPFPHTHTLAHECGRCVCCRWLIHEETEENSAFPPPPSPLLQSVCNVRGVYT